MSNVKEFPKNLSVDSLKSFWEISNPSNPKVKPQRIEHNEQMPMYVDEESKIGLFIPQKVAKSLKLDLGGENIVNVSIHSQPMNLRLVKTGPVRLIWLGTLAEIEEREKYPDLMRKKEPILIDVFVWNGKSFLNYFKCVEKQ